MARTVLRRFLVIQALMLWQGGFLFYTAVVVPIGTDEHGAFGQGVVTRHVTDWMNLFGAGTLAVLAWDQWVNGDGRASRRMRWGLWVILAAGLGMLAVLHGQIEPYIDSSMSYQEFYRLHRAYLIVATVQWVAAVGYVAVMLRAWATGPRPHFTRS